MKKHIKGFVVGVFFTLMFSSAVVVAANQSGVMREVFFGVNVVVNGQRQNFSDETRPFTTGGVVFLPAHSIANALGIPVNWNEATQTIYLGQVVTPVETTVTTLFNRQHTSVGNATWFNAWGDEDTNFIRLLHHRNWPGGDSHFRSNYVEYMLDGAINSIFTGILMPTNNNHAVEIVYRIYGDSRLLYTSPAISDGTAPVPFEINISGVTRLRIEIDVTRTRNILATGRPIGSIQNATITTSR